MVIPFKNCEKGDYQQGGKYVTPFILSGNQTMEDRFGSGNLCLDLTD